MPAPINFLPLFAAACAYGLFVAHAIAIRIGRKPDPLRVLSRNHLSFSPLYFAACWFLAPLSWGDIFVGFYAYIAFHYPFGFIVFGSILRGFSLNICTLAVRQGGKLTEADVFRSYADGRGIEFAKADRLKVLREFGMLEEVNGKLRLTPRAEFCIRANRIFLRIFGLDYLGRKDG